MLTYPTTRPKQLQVIEIMGKIKLRLKRSVKGIYIVEIWMQEGANLVRASNFQGHCFHHCHVVA